MNFFVFAVILLFADCAFAADRYTRAQLDLAGQIGAAIAVAKKCGIPTSTLGILKELRAAGLDSADFTNPTEFSKRIQDQANAVGMSFGLMKSHGKSDADVKEHACSSAIGNYGKSGSIRAGLVND